MKDRNNIKLWERNNLQSNVSSIQLLIDNLKLFCFRSLVLMFDELVRHDKVLSESCEEQFLKFVMSTHQMVKKKEDMANENIRLNSELIKSHQEIRVLEEKLKG